jgi:hypothetical protein
VTGAHAWLWDSHSRGRRSGCGGRGADEPLPADRHRRHRRAGQPRPRRRRRPQRARGMRGRGISVDPDPRRPDALQGVHILRNHVRDFARATAAAAARTSRGAPARARAGSTRTCRCRHSWSGTCSSGSASTASASRSSRPTISCGSTPCSTVGADHQPHGERNRIVANWLERDAGHRRAGPWQQILGNVLVDSGVIRVMGGDVAPDGWRAAAPPGRGRHGSGRQRAGRITVATRSTARTTTLSRIIDFYRALCRTTEQATLIPTSGLGWFGPCSGVY